MAEDPLVAFVRARLDEEERDARATIGEPWLDVDWAEIDDEPVTHIRRQDPAATLARVEALRGLVEAHCPEGAEYPSGPWCERCWGMQSDAHEGWPCDVIKGVAAIWRDHPDYQQDWAP